MALRTVIIIIFSFQAMLNLTRPSLTLYASDLGASALDIGILTSVYNFFPLLFAIRAGKIADRIGDRLPVLIGMITVSIGLSLPYLFPAIWSLYISQVVVGLAHIFIIISLQNVLGHAATKENRDHYFALFSMFAALSQFISPVLGGYLAEYQSYSATFFVAAVCGIVPIAAAMWIPVIKGDKLVIPSTSESGNSLALLKSPILRKAMIGSALVLYSRDIFVAYFPLYANSIDISDSNIGWIVSLQALAMVPVRFFLARLSQSLGRERVLLSSILIAGAAFLLIPTTTSVPVLMALALMMGVGLGCGQPLSMTTIYNASPKNKTGEVLGLRLAINRVTQLGAPVLFGMIGSSVGLLAVFITSGIFLVGGAFYTHPKAAEIKEVE